MIMGVDLDRVCTGVQDLQKSGLIILLGIRSRSRCRIVASDETPQEEHLWNKKGSCFASFVCFGFTPSFVEYRKEEKENNKQPEVVFLAIHDTHFLLNTILDMYVYSHRQSKKENNII